MARILTVEDDEAIRTLIHHALAQYGYDVTVAASGQEAIESLDSGEFDLAILDLMLGGELSGWDVVEAIKNKGLRDRTKVMIMTARTEEAEILKGWRLGVDQYCLKPFDLDKFIEAIRGVLLSTTEQLARRRGQELRKAELLHMVDTVFEDD